MSDETGPLAEVAGAVIVIALAGQPWISWPAILAAMCCVTVISIARSYTRERYDD